MMERKKSVSLKIDSKWSTFSFTPMTNAPIVPKIRNILFMLNATRCGWANDDFFFPIHAHDHIKCKSVCCYLYENLTVSRASGSTDTNIHFNK